MMKPETIEYIRATLKNEVQYRQSRLMDAVRYDTDDQILEAVNSYKELYSINEDFEEWVDQEEEETVYGE